MDLTPILAFWGTIVSTVAVTWNIIRSSQDRKKIRVEANIGFILPGDSDKKILYVIMTNVGRRPVYITGVGMSRKKKKGEKGKPGLFMTARNLPMMLKEGDYNIEYSEKLSIFTEYEITTVKVWDSTNKKWRISKKNLRNLIENAKEVLEQSQNSQ